ncbi:hypothetical protein BJ138DRAFT_1121107, partial [Hygrophoropsis aurantiaca]
NLLALKKLKLAQLEINANVEDTDFGVREDELNPVAELDESAPVDDVMENTEETSERATGKKKRGGSVRAAVSTERNLLSHGDAGDRGARDAATESDDECSDERSNGHASKSLFPISNAQHAGTIPEWTEQVIDDAPHKAPSIKSIRTVSAATTKSSLRSIFTPPSDSDDTEQTIANDPMFNFKYGGLPDEINNYGDDGPNAPTVKLTKGLLHTLLNASLQTPANGDLLKVLGRLTDATPVDQPGPEPDESESMDVDNANAGADSRSITNISRGSAPGLRTNVPTTPNRPVSKTSARQQPSATPATGIPERSSHPRCPPAQNPTRQHPNMRSAGRDQNAKEPEHQPMARIQTRDPSPDDGKDNCGPLRPRNTPRKPQIKPILAKCVHAVVA